MSIFGIASSGLNAFQRALDVTYNNIANASTKGYSRQSVDLKSTISQRFAGSYVGSGVKVASIYRNVDDFATYQVRGTISVKSQYDAYFQQSSQIDKLLSQEGSSLSTSMQSFFDALGQLNNEPDSGAARNVALKQSQLLASQFKSLQNKLDEYQNNSSQQISEALTQINRITTGIAAVNGQLMSQPNAPELMDQRDELVKELSQYMELSSVVQPDGTVNVGTANGDMLVTGTSSRNFGISPDRSSSLGTTILLGTGAGQIDITKKLTTGMLGGLLDYQSNVLGKSSQLIGQMAIGLSQEFNAQHQLGVDLNNQIGKQFFTDFNSVAQQLSRSISSSANTGTAVLSVDISDIGQTKLSDYDLVVSDTGTNQIRLMRKSDGTSTILNWSSSPPAPPGGQITIDGMTIKVDDISHLANNDRFILTPTRAAARSMDVMISDAREIALAAPVRTQASLNNTGTGRIALGTVVNTTEVTKQYRIDFISDTQYNLVNVTDSTSTGPLIFTPNSDNTIQIPDGLNPSYSVVVSGIPKAGDQFSAEFNTGAARDNRNGLGLASMQQSKLFAGGSENLLDRYTTLLSEVGSQTNDAKTRAATADTLYKQAVNYQQSKSGVNLDEEAANIIKFKQAYEAAGKVMQISSEMISILFNIMR